MLSEKERFIILVDNDYITKSDAIILLEGDGFSRIETCAKLYHDNLAPVICFSGGAKNIEYGSFPFEMFDEKIISLNLTKANIIHDSNSQNTREQAKEILNIAFEKKWKKIILVASHFHQYRAYLTFLKVMYEINYNLIVINYPSRTLPWFESEVWGCRIDLLEREFEKIEEYTKNGHCATFLQAIEYQKWKESLILRK